MRRELIDTIIIMIEENVPKEVIMKVTEIEEYFQPDQGALYHITNKYWPKTTL